MEDSSKSSPLSRDTKRKIAEYVQGSFEEHTKFSAFCDAHPYYFGPNKDYRLKARNQLKYYKKLKNEQPGNWQNVLISLGLDTGLIQQEVKDIPDDEFESSIGSLVLPSEKSFYSPSKVLPSKVLSPPRKPSSKVENMVSIRDLSGGKRK